MSAAEHRKIVVEFSQRPPPGDLRRVVDVLIDVLGKMVSLADVTLLADATAVVVTNAAASPGTSLATTRCFVDFADAGVDQVRVIVRGNAGAAGTVQVTVHDITNNVELGRVAVTNGTDVTVAGAWTTITPTGLDQEIEVRVIGNGVLDPALLRVSLQLRTLQAS